MNHIEREEIKTAIKEAVAEQLPEALVEQLEPMVQHSQKVVLRKEHRIWFLGYVLLAAACAILFIQQHIDRNHAIHSNIEARYADCKRGNDLRRALRLIVLQSRDTAPLIRKTFPNLPPEFFQRQKALEDFELKSFADHNCVRSANAANP